MELTSICLVTIYMGKSSRIGCCCVEIPRDLGAGHASRYAWIARRHLWATCGLRLSWMVLPATPAKGQGDCGCGEQGEACGFWCNSGEEDGGAAVGERGVEGDLAVAVELRSLGIGEGVERG